MSNKNMNNNKEYGEYDAGMKMNNNTNFGPGRKGNVVV